MARGRSRPFVFVLLLALLLSVLPVRLAAAQYYMQFANLDVYDDNIGQGVHDGYVITRFANRFHFGFYDQLDPASVAPSVTVTGPDGSTLAWRLDLEPGNHWFSLYPPGPLEPAAQYILRVRGGPDGILSADGVPIQADLVFHLTTDNTPFSFVLMRQLGGDGATDRMSDGAVLARNAQGLEFRFSHPVDADSARQAIRITRQDGSDPGWQIAVRGAYVTLTWNDRLPRTEEWYRISIAGEDAGIRDVVGQTLPASTAMSVRTLNQAYQFGATLQTNWKQYEVLQRDVWRFQAETGTLYIRLGWDGTPAVVEVAVVDVDRQTVLHDRFEYVRGDRTLSVSLPHAGPYALAIFNNRLAEVGVWGLELQFPTVTPALSMPQMGAFEVKNSAFAVTPVVKNPEATDGVGIYQNRVTLFEGKPNADGSIPPVMVDTGDMPDGPFYLTVAGWAQETGNEGVQIIPLLVDRQDSFADVPASYWARRYIEAMHDLGIVNGRPGGYEPGEPVTRAEFAKLLALTLQLKPAADTPNPFADVPAGHWAEEYIRALWRYGVIVGDVVDGQRYFYPNKTISRAEAATILGRVLGLSTITPEGTSFMDWAEVPDWAKPSVQALSVMGWINGFPDGSYQPAGQLQRDQAAKLLAQFLAL